jgi:hypothetical protein
LPPLQSATSGPGGTTPDGADDPPATDAGPDDAEVQDALETARPEPQQSPLLTPREGRWRARNGPLRLVCDGLNLDQPALPPEDGRLLVRKGGDRLLLRGFSEGSQGTVRVDRRPNRPERYVGRFPPIQVQGGRVRLDLVLDVVSPERMEGVLRGTARVQGYRCDATREFGMRYLGR